MPSLLIAVIVWQLLWHGFGQLLRLRQAASIRRHRDAVPPAFVGSVTLDEHCKAAAYSLARLRLGGLASLVELAIGLVGLVWVLNAVSGLVARHMAPSILRSLVILAALWLCSTLAVLPLSAWRDLVLEQRFGFNRKSAGLFTRDAVVSLLLSAAIGLPVLAGILWAMQALHGPWWVAVWAALTGAMLIAPSLYVRLLAPLFNRFTPLRPEMAARIDALVARCGFRAGALFEMDASRRSSRGNAYFIGFGPTKRIVLFDTLLDAHSPEEIEAVVAHELGHFRHRHILFGLAQGIVSLFAVLAAIGWLSRQPWLMPEFGITHPDPALGLLLAGVVVSTVSPLVGLAGNAMSRRNEFQADDFARCTVGATPMVSALIRLARDNATTLTPDWLYSLVHDTHPPVPVRIARLAS